MNERAAIALFFVSLLIVILSMSGLLVLTTLP